MDASTGIRNITAIGWKEKDDSTECDHYGLY